MEDPQLASRHFESNAESGTDPVIDRRDSHEPTVLPMPAFHGRRLLGYGPDEVEFLHAVVVVELPLFVHLLGVVARRPDLEDDGGRNIVLQPLPVTAAIALRTIEHDHRIRRRAGRIPFLAGEFPARIPEQVAGHEDVRRVRELEFEAPFQNGDPIVLKRVVAHRLPVVVGVVRIVDPLRWLEHGERHGMFLGWTPSFWRLNGPIERPIHCFHFSNRFFVIRCTRASTPCGRPLWTCGRMKPGGALRPIAQKIVLALKTVFPFGPG